MLRSIGAKPVITVARHRVDMSFVDEQAQRNLRLEKRDIEYTREEPTPSWLHGALSRCLRNAQYWSFFDKSGSSLRMNRSLRLAAHAGTALFSAAASQEESIDVWLDGPLKIPTYTPRGFTSPGAWRGAFYCAVLCRDYDLIQKLISIPIDHVFVAGSDECFYSWVQALQSFWRNDEQLRVHFNQTLYDIENRQFTSKRVIDLLLLPQVILCQALLTGDADIFNQELANTLQAHRKFFLLLPQISMTLKVLLVFQQSLLPH